MTATPQSTPQLHLWTAAQVAAVVVTIISFVPDDLIINVMNYLQIPDHFRPRAFSSFQYRLITAIVGVAVIMMYVIFYERKAQTPSLINDDGKPSVAVLPFVNMSDNKSQEYFADGMTGDIITSLSCDSRLQIISRNSTFTYKGKQADSRAIGKEFGVRYMVAGSIRPVNDRLRITVELIDTASGNHIWSDRIDRPAAEIFNVMDEVVAGLVTTLCSNLGANEAALAARQRPEDLQAWALCTQAETLYFTQPSLTSVLEANKLVERATSIDPGYAIGWALLSFLTAMQMVWGQVSDQVKESAKLLSLVNKALWLAPHDPVVLGYCGYGAIWAGQVGQAIGCLERSLAINPNSSFSRLHYGAALYTDARAEEAITQLELFLRQSPKDPYVGVAYFFLSRCYLLLDPHKAEDAARNTIKHSPSFAWGYVTLAMSLAALGRGAEAQKHVQKVLQLEPGFTRQRVEDYWRGVLREQEQSDKMIALAQLAWTD